MVYIVSYDDKEECASAKTSMNATPTWIVNGGRASIPQTGEGRPPRVRGRVASRGWIAGGYFLIQVTSSDATYYIEVYVEAKPILNVTFTDETLDCNVGEY